MKHTKGPWKVHKTEYETEILGNFSETGSAHIVVGHANCQKDKRILSDADAQLIAEAPSMFKFITDLVEAVQDCIPDLEHYVSTHGPGPDRRLERVKQLIGKGKERT